MALPFRRAGFHMGFLILGLLLPGSWARAGESSPPAGPSTDELEQGEILAGDPVIARRMDQARADLSRCARLWREGRAEDCQRLSERTMAALHVLRSQVPMSYAQNAELVGLLQQGAGLRLKCVRQTLSLRTSLEPRIFQDEEVAADSDSTPVASLPADSLLATDQARALDPVQNSRVDTWIRYYSGPGHRTFQVWLERSQDYLGMMLPVLRRQGVPEDLVHLVFVESGFNPTAISTSAASGPWQFLAGTARIFGLKVDGPLDERRDPRKSTEAAAQYLKHLYTMFHDWPLALAAYNSGEGTVLRALKNQNRYDFWSLNLPRQTMDYVPAFMAAMTIARDPAAYGFKPAAGRSALSSEQLVVPGAINLSTIARVTRSPLELLRRLNPSLLGERTPARSGGTLVRVPEGTADLVMEKLKTSGVIYRAGSAPGLAGPVPPAYAESPTKRSFVAAGPVAPIPGPDRPVAGPPSPMVVEASMAPPAGPRVHAVGPGETLFGVARAHGLSIARLRELNGLPEGSILHPGDQILVR